MISLTTPSPLLERPRGIFLVAALAFGAAIASIGVGLLNATGVLPLSAGASLIGGGLEILGPGVFVLYAVVTAAAGIGLLQLRNWARRLAILILLFGLLQTVPAISMAVADARVVAIARSGLQIILRTAALWYLCQEPVRDAFA